jgi:hypothetical protein
MASAHYQPPCSLFDAKAIDCNLGGCIQSDDIAHPKPQYLQHLLVVTLLLQASCPQLLFVLL